jgi:predicted nucleic acid-binding protein
VIYSSNFIVVLDACVLYPAPVRDLLLSFADSELFKPKWSSRIQEEWCRNLLLKRPDLSQEQLDMTVRAMNMAFPDAQIEKFESLIPGISMPDKNDRHVVAAAIRAKADVIVTYNLKHFPQSVGKEYDIEILHQDIFLTNVYDLHPEKATESFIGMVKRLRKPPKSSSEVLEALLKSGLKNTVEKLKSA